MAPTRDKLLNRWGALKSERASWLSHWQEISTNLLPYQGRYFVQDRNRGERRANSIYDSSSTRALRVLGAGLMAGATSPARPWFRLATSDPDLNSYHTVKVWLSDVANLMQAVFQKSNTYRAFHQMYEEMGAFGTASCIEMPDFKNVIYSYVLTAGEYAISADYRGNVDTLYREFELPVSALIKEFGYENASLSVRNLYDRGDLDSWISLIHAIEPRADRDITKKDNKNMPWASYYFEPNGDPNKFLRESGFPSFPCLVPRWAVAGGDIYGNSPAMEALGDVKQLQHQQLRKGQVIDYKTKPPLQAPMSMKNNPTSMLPGGISYVDMSNPGNVIKSAFEATLDMSHLLVDIQDVRQRINSAFYADMFLMLANGTDTTKTATEIAERHEEKLIMLGPTLERIHNDLLNPKVEKTFDRMLAARIVPPPPDELRGVEINVEFISMLAQAQRAIGVNSVDRWMGNIGAIAAFKPDVLDKVDADYYVDAYADMLGVDPKMIVANDKVAIVRQQRANDQAAMQQAALAEQNSKTVSNLAGAPTDGDTALTNVIDMFSGYNTPQVGG